MKNGERNVVMPEMAFEEMLEPRSAIKEMPLEMEEKALKEKVKDLELEKVVISPDLFALFPAAPHYTGLMNEMYNRAYFGKNILWRLYQSAFQSISLYTGLRVTSGSAWNEKEKATYRVWFRNYSGFDMTDVVGKLTVIPGTGDAKPHERNVPFGNVPHNGGWVYKEFPLQATETGEGNVTLKLKFTGKIGDFREEVIYDGTSFRWDGAKWVKYIKSPFERKYTIYPH